MTTIKFAKLRPDAKIPSKETENAGYDIYAAFDEDYIAISPGQTVMVPTGLCSAFSEDYVMILKERGSTGTKGMGQRSGVIDSGYRGEWFIPITNHNSFKTIFISKLSLENTLKDYYKDMCMGIDNLSSEKLMNSGKFILYPYEKAIAQALLLPVPQTTICEMLPEEIQTINSNRGIGALGSSGK